MRHYTLLILGLLIPILGCKKESIPNEHPPVLFQYEFVNNAWLPTHHGWFITPEAKVMAYNLPEVWNDVDEKNQIKREFLQKNLDRAHILQEVTVTSRNLGKYYSSIPDLRESRIIESSTYMADAGIAALYAYLLIDDRTCERVLIAQSGDITRWSNYGKTTSLKNWLLKIGEEAGDLVWFDIK